MSQAAITIPKQYKDSRNVIAPQAGFQTKFLSSPADIVIGGGAAGGGKTYAELMEAARHKDVKGFTAAVFRRTEVQINNLGGLWENSMDMYIPLGGLPNATRLLWKFPSGARIKMSGLELESSIFKHQGGQYCLIVFDELTHFSLAQFLYMMSRNRSLCGVRPYIRATTNPDPESWVADMLAWWIDQESGFPIPDRAGVIRYMFYYSGNWVAGNTVQEVVDQLPPEAFDHIPEGMSYANMIKSVTFIPGTLYENKALMAADPGYIGNLLGQTEAEQYKLLHGNWKVKTDGMGIFVGHALDSLFSNEITDVKGHYITCDAARFGQDLMVIMVWQGWKVVRILIAAKSDENLIVKLIEEQRTEFTVMKSNVLIDQDGVGGGTRALGGYEGFSGGAAPLKEPEQHSKENYKNLKTQCYYRAAERVNNGTAQIVATSQNVIIVELSGRRIRGLDIVVGGKMYNVPALIKKQLRAIKKKNPDMDGKKQINDKADQKIILGMSPDFADTFSMRAWFDLRPSGYNVY